MVPLYTKLDLSAILQYSFLSFFIFTVAHIIKSFSCGMGFNLFTFDYFMRPLKGLQTILGTFIR